MAQTDQLMTVAKIVGQLGLSIADAQREFDANYINRMTDFVKIANSFLKSTGQDNAVAMREILMKLAPSHYQFTETTLTVKMDLSQSLSVSAGLGVSVGVGAVAVNASMSVAYGSDQRSAAEIKTVIHAIPADRGVVDVLLQRAKDMPSASLPERPQTKDTLAAAGDLIKVFGTAQPAPA
jgi:hypothetical protein